MIDVCVIGAGPAGLMAAETAANRGLSVLIIDAKPSFGRKFLMAGKSGLNLSMDEVLTDFLSAYGSSTEWLRPMISKFGVDEVKLWANDLGQQLFTGSSRRIFPVAMKASPLLRAWLAQLGNLNVTFKRGWRWTGWAGDALTFDTTDGVQSVNARTTILALGGASWSRLGSDGLWSDILLKRCVALAPFQPSNMGFTVNWSPYMAEHFGSPIKNTRFTAGSFSTLGECVISDKGIEGSAIYAASRFMRDGMPLVLDLLPDQSEQVLINRIKTLPAKASRATIIRKGLRLDGAKAALLNEFGKGAVRDDLALLAKSLPITHAGPRPIDEAISTAGGVTSSAVDDKLMLKDIPSVFCAGEMLDWEAPTGGYLITACLATGQWAGNGAADYLMSPWGHGVK
jgi:uncharacterized flavoprotein (TIGR03862 family)